jgi:O-6-methylguanine DNA methyltransferase
VSGPRLAPNDPDSSGFASHGTGRRAVPLTMSTEFERAFYASDGTFDGRFVAAVRTTGIYCRPSCRVSKPLPRNVTYLPDASAAREAGYRACLRCHPDEASPVTIRQIDTPIGPMTIGATASAVVLADFTDRPMMPAQLASVRRRIGPMAPGASPLLDRVEAQLTEYFAGERRDFDLPLDHPGSEFQERVWGELRRIPYGETISYRELALWVGSPQAPRAVGRANGSNRLAVIVPCHRVVASGGGLGGYGGGLPAKRYLLDLEAGVVSRDHRRAAGGRLGLSSAVLAPRNELRA